ncbi:cytochrome c-type biogenesis protein [Rhizobium sp. GR12]|uniref:cytochrome c-type biogenesis protein n=1 Tax=Rhizobium sp. GR12 TaxID=3053925 RepID=UPI002FBED1A3
MREGVVRLTLLLTLIFAAFPASAFNPDEVLKDPVLEQRARNLTSQLRCMVCQNQSIDDSNAELARDLRVLVRDRLVEGDSDRAVIDYVVSRYGEFVLLKPRLSLRTVLLWGAPIGLTLAGIFAVFIFSRRRATQERPQKLSADEEERIRNLIEK